MVSKNDFKGDFYFTSESVGDGHPDMSAPITFAHTILRKISEDCRAAFAIICNLTGQSIEKQLLLAISGEIRKATARSLGSAPI